MKTLSEHLYKSLKQLAVLFVIFAASLIFSNKSIAQVTCPAGGIARNVSGVAQAWTPGSTWQNATDNTPVDALNAPDGEGVQLWFDQSNVLTLDLATVVPEGNDVTLHLANAGANFVGPVEISSSVDGSTFGGAVTHTPTEIAPSYEEFDYEVPTGGARFIRITPLDNSDQGTAVRVDAVTYEFEFCEAESGVDFVQHGSFEGFPECSLQAGAIGAWQVVQDDVHIWGENCGLGWVSPDGVNSLDLDGTTGSTGIVEQTMTGLIPGNTYNLTFYMAFNPAAGAASSSMQMQIADFDETYTSASNATIGGFNLVHVVFTATNSTEVLRFESLTGSGDPNLLNGGGTPGWGVVVDDIRITPTDFDEDPGVPPLPTFVCTTDAYLFQDFPTDVWEGDLVSGQFTEVASEIEDTHINGVGYNPLDDYIYGWSNSTAPGGGTYPTGLVRIGSDYSVEYLGIPDGLTAATLIGHGDIDSNGHYWARVSDTDPNQWVQIDLDPNSTTYLEVLDSGEFTANQSQRIHADWSFSPLDGLLYALWTTAADEVVLVSFDRDTHQLTNEGTLSNQPSAGRFGATYMDDEGNLYASQNNSGQVWRINTADATSELFSQGPSSTFNDGARCPIPVYTDYGDAPDSYGTTLAEDGPRHGIPDFNEGNGTASLMLGATIDSETDGQPNTTADGDSDDEDGVTVPELVRGTTIDIEVEAGDVGPDTRLQGWIDWAGDGTFGPEDQVFADVQVIDGVNTISVTVPVDAEPGDTYARFRIANESGLGATGAASSGEVEDYQVTISAEQPTFTCDSTMYLGIGIGGGQVQLHSVDTSTNPFDFPTIGDPVAGYNAIGYDPNTNYIYTVRWDATTSRQRLLRIGGDGTVQDMGEVLGGGINQPPSQANFATGVVGTDGFYYGKFNGPTAGDVDAHGRMYQIDLNARTAVRIDLTFNGNPINIVSGDWASHNGLLYAHDHDNDRLYTVDPGTGAVDIIGTSGVPTSGFGSMISASNGVFGRLNSGAFYQFDPVTGDATLISNAPSGAGDGAKCPTTAVTLPADTQIIKDDGSEYYATGGQVTYEIVVSNNGPFGVQNALVNDPLPAGVTDAEWTCGDATGGATCSVASGTGSIEDVAVNLPDQASVTFKLMIEVPSGFTGDLTNTATVRNPADVPDPDPDNNEASDTDTPLEPWVCTPDGILSQGGLPTQLQFVDLVTGDVETGVIELDGRSTNAMAYNVVDDYIYTWDGTIPPGSTQAVGIVRIGADGQVQELGIPTGMNPDDTASGQPVADIDDNGHYWFGNSTGSGSNARWYQIDLNPGPTFMQVLESGQMAGNPTGIPEGAFAGSGDWAWVPGGGDNLWRVMRNTNTNNWHLIRFDRSTGTNHNMGQLPALNPEGVSTFGAVFADEQFLYVSNNTSGNIYRVDVVAETASFFTDGPPSGNNDGARCAIAPINTDYGDAPEEYGTLLEDNGPRHGLRDFDEGNQTTSLMLGEHVSHETDGQPSADADTDNPDDGVADPIVLVPGEPTTVSVEVTNNTGEVATLAGWIDLNGDGDFEDNGELQTAAIPDTPGTDTYDLEFGPATFSGGDTYARFRVFPGDVSDPSPTGPASAGEVEDYLVSSNDFTITLTGGECFRLLSSPVDGLTYQTMLQDIWTQGADNSNHDVGDPNVWSWDVGTQDWTPVPNLDTVIPPGQGFLVSVFADDDYDGTDDPFPKTLTLPAGAEHSAPLGASVGTAGTDEWILLGNPFQSNINTVELTSNASDLYDAYYVYDRSIPGWRSTATGFGELTDGAIAAGQGFFVQAGGDNPSLEFTDPSKTTDGEFYGKQSEPALSSVGEGGRKDYVRLEISGEGVSNALWIRFSQAGAMERTRGDALKLEPLSEQYALLGARKGDGTLMDIAHYPLGEESLEIPVSAEATEPGTYTLSASELEVPVGMDLYLYDRQAGESVVIDDQFEYSFTIGQAGKIPEPATGGMVGCSAVPQRAKTSGTDRFVISSSPGVPSSELPEEVALGQNYPNPFNPSTVISYQLPAVSQVRLEVFDLTGRLVATLVDGQVGTGTHQVNFDAGNLSSGVYLYRLQVLGGLGEGGQTANRIITKKLTLIK